MGFTDETNPLIYFSPRGPCGPYTLTLLPEENPTKVGKGGAWSTGLDHFFMYPKSFLCWVYGGHDFVEYEREYHYDSSETANTQCTRCNMWVPF